MQGQEQRKDQKRKSYKKKKPKGKRKHRAIDGEESESEFAAGSATRISSSDLIER